MRTTPKSRAVTSAGAEFIPARVLIVPDKFKGTLAAADACSAIARGWKSVRVGDHLELMPMSDGGDGFGEVMGRLLEAQPRSIPTLDAAHRPIKAPWWWVPNRKLAIIESACVIGLARLPAKKFHPFQLDTFGLGRVLEAVIRSGATRCVIGIGGSATNDAGFGLAQALGWKFLDRKGAELTQWWQLNQLARVVPPSHGLKLDITVAVDVLNPLLGSRGCSRVYGLQKGIRPEELPFAEKCLRRLAVVLEQQLGMAHAKTAGVGAAGGFGFGLMAFAGAIVRSGFDEFAQAAHLEKRIGNADLVITGEGAVDQQTFMGKGVGQVLNLCRKLKVPCIALAGVVNAPVKSVRLFSAASAMTEIATMAQATSRPEYYLEKLSAIVARSALLAKP